MSYIGSGMYYAETCPLCGSTLWNGVCENRDCDYHWVPKKDDNEEYSEYPQKAIFMN